MHSSKYSLTLSKLPDIIQSEDGKEYPVQADFRTILSCLKRLGDEEKEDLQKALYVAVKFFKSTPPPDMWKQFEAFVMSGEKTEDDEAMMDFEQDAEAIYTSFWQQYGIDLLQADLHWSAFLMLLRGLGSETRFGEILKIRGMEMTDVPEKDRPKLRKLKEMVAVRPKISDREAALSAELDKRLAAGEDPADIIRQMQEV